MSQKRIYLCLAHMSGNEMKFIQEAFDTNWVVPLGPNVNGFEEDLKQFAGGEKEIVALSAGFFTSCYLFGGNTGICRFGTGYMEYGSAIAGKSHTRPYGENRQKTESYCSCLSVWHACKN